MALTAPITVVIPSYNYAQFVGDAVDSVLSQTVQPEAIIVVNDGSTDNTLEALERYRYYNNITIFTKPNAGLAAARNSGFELAATEFVLPLDADDMIAPTYIEKVFPLVVNNPKVGAAFARAKLFGPAAPEKNSWPLDQPINYEEWPWRNQATYCSIMRKAAWQDCGGYDTRMTWGGIQGYADWELWIDLVEHGWLVEKCYETLFLYRKHGRSMISSSAGIHNHLLGIIQSLHPQVYKKKRPR